MPPAIVLVDTEALLQTCLLDLDKKPDCDLAIDAEGYSLGRYGTLSAFQVYLEGGETICVIAFAVMGPVALKKIDPCIPSLQETLMFERRKVRDETRYWPTAVD